MLHAHAQLSKEREIVSMFSASACSEDFCEGKNYEIMKVYIAVLCKGITSARELISCKEHRVPWASL